jgi:hypothetical protein
MVYKDDHLKMAYIYDEMCGKKYTLSQGYNDGKLLRSVQQ